MRDLAVLLGCLALVVGGVANAQDAPLGLTWGMTVDETKALGLEMHKQDASEEAYNAISGFAKPLSTMESALLMFGYDGRLRSIIVLMPERILDPQLDSVITTYNELKRLLEGKYDIERDVFDIDDSYGVRGRASTLALGRTKIVSEYDGDGVDIKLSVIRSGVAGARVAVLYEHIALTAEYEHERAIRNADAL